MAKNMQSQKVRLPSEVVLRQRSSSFNVHLPPQVVFYQKAVFHQKSSSVKGHLLFKGPLPSKVVFYKKSFSIKDCLPSKVVFCHRLSSVKGCLPSKVIFRRCPSLFFVPKSPFFSNWFIFGSY